MASEKDLWAEIAAGEGNDYTPQEPEIAVVYQRQRRTSSRCQAVPSWERKDSISNRLSLAPVTRISWNRSLSTRGRTSMTVESFLEYLPQQRKNKKKAKPPLPKGTEPKPNFEKEIAYFQEVDSFELMEESPSPKKPTTWIMGVTSEKAVLPHLSSVLQKWLIAQRRGCGLPPSLSRILETPATRKKTIASSYQASGALSFRIRPSIHSVPNRIDFSNVSEIVSVKSVSLDDPGRGFGEIDWAVGKLSLASNPSSLDDQNWDPLLALLTACGQSSPSTFLDVLSTYSDKEVIIKVGEGTYGEAFKVGKTVCKIVPFNGEIRVNGELQKRAEELLEEVMLSCTLNQLRSCENHVLNACTSFIQTLDLRVCQGHYDAALIRAWEDWDEKHGSENDHPKQFPQNQCYIVFVQEHGGQDLESFVLLNFDEARSLLVQVTLALAVAEAAYEFEHRDLHWGNILLNRKGSEMLSFTLEGKNLDVRTHGLSVSIIDFTLSRINTGEDILFLDLSSDPEIFEGPKGDKQFETYRKMRDVTDECWEGSFPKTNVLWLQYLVDMLLLKKSYDRSSKNERDLRSLKKRLNSYESAKDAAEDPFFSDLIIQKGIFNSFQHLGINQIGRGKNVLHSSETWRLISEDESRQSESRFPR
ncbi:OLC1v1038687C1 [Oldenlandia corymbosa var. corymbosa]|uniref:non-specific serine/threonine protein kinase n=1 Tax=Oldenlandia corymbosa var. corymbosa TaxID=529605 RepID=A0AAV1D0Z1_OLDCO|nr:OLC1v1038687C1 [Oldenlandia corymbosa var. corymbosa]